MKSGPGPALRESPSTTDAPTSTSRRTEPHSDVPQKPAAAGFRYGKWVFGLTALAFFGFIGVRISEATKTKQAVATERDVVAAQVKETAQKPRQIEVRNREDITINN